MLLFSPISVALLSSLPVTSVSQFLGISSSTTHLLLLRRVFWVILICLHLQAAVSEAHAQDPSSQPPPITLGPEYKEWERGGGSSKVGNGTTSEGNLITKVLLFLPNRVLDLIDIFKFDVGVGPSKGAVFRVSRWGQGGYREMSPASLRVGIRGRELPIFLERSNEFGFGPGFVESSERTVTPLELGAGIDLFLVGAYFGISFDELFDFLGGIVGFDFKDDDLK